MVTTRRSHRLQQQRAAVDLIHEYQTMQVNRRPVGAVREIAVDHLGAGGLAGALRKLRREQHDQQCGCRLVPGSRDVEVRDVAAADCDGIHFLATSSHRTRNGDGETEVIGAVRLRLPRAYSAFGNFSYIEDIEAAKALYESGQSRIGIIESLYVRIDRRRTASPGGGSTTSFDLAQAVLNKARSLSLDSLLFEPENEALRQKYQALCGGAMQKVQGGVRLHSIDVPAVEAHLAVL